MFVEIEISVEQLCFQLRRAFNWRQLGLSAFNYVQNKVFLFFLSDTTPLIQLNEFLLDHNNLLLSLNY